MEDDFSVENNLQWKTTSKQGKRMSFFMLIFLKKIRSTKVFLVNGRRPLVNDDLWWKTTFGGRRPSVEDNLLWKTSFGG